jgi:hypothetical protein
MGPGAQPIPPPHPHLKTGHSREAPSVTAAVDSIAIAGDPILLRAPFLEALISSIRHVHAFAFQ